MNLESVISKLREFGLKPPSIFPLSPLDICQTTWAMLYSKTGTHRNLGWVSKVWRCLKEGTMGFQESLLYSNAHATTHSMMPIRLQQCSHAVQLNTVVDAAPNCQQCFRALLYSIAHIVWKVLRALGKIMAQGQHGPNPSYLTPLSNAIL